MSISNGLTGVERETHFNVSADNRHEVTIFTDDPVWYDRLAKWFDPVWCNGAAARFVVPTVLVIRESALVNGTDRLAALVADHRNTGVSDIEND